MDGEQRGLHSGTPVNNARRQWGKNWGHGPPHNCPIFRFLFAFVKCFFQFPPRQVRAVIVTQRLRVLVLPRSRAIA
jgi:hypothetical protein